MYATSGIPLIRWNDGIGETTSVALEVTFVYLADTNGCVGEKRIFLLSSLEEVETVVCGGGVKVVLHHYDVKPCPGSRPGVWKGASARGDLYIWMSIVRWLWRR